MSDEKKSETIVGLIKEIPEFIMKITNWLKYFTYRLSKKLVDSSTEILYLQENCNIQRIYYISLTKTVIRNIIYSIIYSTVSIILYVMKQEDLMHILIMFMFTFYFIECYMIIYKNKYEGMMRVINFSGILVSLVIMSIVYLFFSTREIILGQLLRCLGMHIFATIILWVIIEVISIHKMWDMYVIDETKKCIDIKNTKKFIIKNGKKVIKRIKIHDFGVYIENKDVICLYNFKDNEITKYTFTNIPGMRRITSIEIGYTIITSSNVDDYI